jgi:hypothetical protein
MAPSLLDAGGGLILGAFDRLMGAVAYFKEQKLEGAALFRACFLEVNGNLELLKLLRRDDSTDKEMRAGLDNDALLRYLCRLQITASASILLDTRSAGTDSPLQKQFQGDFSLFLKKIAFVAGRAEAFRQLEDLDSDEKKLLHGINLTVRIDNLFRGLQDLYRILKDQPGVKEVFSET